MVDKDEIGLGGEIEFGLVVWPTYAGLARADGSEIMSDPDYSRGQIHWETIGDTITGHAAVMVPDGEYTHIIYTHHPTEAKILSAQKLKHPVLAKALRGYPMTVNLTRITMDDIAIANQALNQLPIFHT